MPSSIKQPVIHNGPRLTGTLMGRQAEVADLRRLLSDPACGLLTLNGPGGIGKTRLALHVAQESRPDFPDEIWFLPLDQLDPSKAVIPAIAEMIGLSLDEEADVGDQIVAYLRDKQALLIWDSFEAALKAPAVDQILTLLTEILATGPGVKLLVTSRESLNLQEEWLYPVAGLAYPPTTDFDPTTARDEYAAVQLFAERARRVRRDFDLTAEGAGVARICQLVGGVPLALELAAVWTRTLRCSVIAAEIERNLDFLVTNMRNLPERQRSLRAIFEQSWQQLTPTEQALFRRLAVFRGSFSRAAAEQVADASLPTLSALVDQSLLQLGADGRYQLHAGWRQYVAEQMIHAPSEVATLYDRHAAYYTDFLRERLDDLLGGRQPAALADIERDLENIRAAWQWAVQVGQIEAVQQAAQALVLFYQARSRFAEGVAMFEQAVHRLEQWPATEARDGALADLLVILGWLYIRLGRLDEATAVIERSQTLLTALQRPPTVGLGLDPLIPLALLTSLRGEYDQSASLARQACQAHERHGDEHNLAMAYYVLTGATLAQGDAETACRYAQQAYALARSVDNRWFMAYCLNELGATALALGDQVAAKGYYQASYTIRREFDDPEGMAVALNHLGRVALTQGEAAQAERLYKEAHHHYEVIGDQGGLATTLGGLGRAALAQDQLEAARQHFQAALHLAAEINGRPLLLKLLVEIAGWLGHTGQPKQAESLLTVAQRQPATDDETQTQIAEVCKRHNLDIVPDSVEMASSSEDLTTVIAEAQAALAAPVHTPISKRPAPAHRPAYPAAPAIPTPRRDSATLSSLMDTPLVEALTHREFEVLELIAQGMTNKQIAEQLVISIGTTKWYTGQIYGKLNVTNRTQAVARARGLAMLV